jgi:tripeptide aminopeptidase
MIKRRRILESFLKMVKIDSPSKRERRMVDHVKSELRKLGLRAREDGAHRRFGGEAGNVWAVLKGNMRLAPKLLLNAHVDTVAPGIGVKPRIKGAYVVSDGKTILGADNKAGVAVILEVLRNLKKEKVPHGDIVILFSVAEEIGLYGVKNIKKSWLKADMGLTLDGGDVHEIISQAPSQDNLRIEITGRAAHAGVRPEEGVSAIKVASLAISEMKLGRID